ncbi:MAG: DUF2586 family protein [Paludibacter sp.]|nr:DUF2586 family protein [Bacteroidales bacterium]MCM1069832.1 DUF2586 family protein [Prevotella sp.]MCM1353974.1 DUF2586 family protein [Bacteroides sp.]MCM1443384.1 DUF2586 family protein [Muribaculum sp.]MCM1482087.1 DUF2586 family protein [Paludibacter sp.]
MLPYVKIDFSNGALGSVSESADSVVGLVCTASPVAGKLELCKPYILYRLDGLRDLGISSASDDANAYLYEQVRAFYAQAGEGAELWLYGVSNTVKPSEVVDVNGEYAKRLIEQANGRLRCLAVAYAPGEGYQATMKDGLDSDVLTAARAAQALAEWATNSLYAPLFVVLAAHGYSPEHIVDLADLTEYNYNRVGLLIGDTVRSSKGAAIGVLAGRIAACPVQRHIGRVRDGALNIENVYIGDQEASNADVETLHNKGFITFRTFTGKSGYFFTDDCLATAVSDDYRSIARRRTIDKAYRICYQTMLEHVNDEIPVSNEGTLIPAMCKSWETEIVTAIVNQMGVNNELGTDPTDATDNGVQCFIDYAQRVLATNRIDMAVQVKPYGYAKYININLGFITTNTEE